MVPFKDVMKLQKLKIVGQVSNVGHTLYNLFLGEGFTLEHINNFCQTTCL